ncbi:hypothetical protein [Nocardia tenerifensis]|nr:hypothetical protein [Nocardia tenerifensis]
MGGENDGPSRSAGGAEPAAGSSRSGDMTAAQRHSTEAPQPDELPPIPAMEQPDAVLEATPENNELLKASVRRRYRNHRRLVFVTYSILIVLMIALWISRQYEVAVAVLAVIASSAFLHKLRIGPLARSYRALVPREGQTLTIRFGPDAFELQGGTNRRVHVAYNRFRAIAVESYSITLRTRNSDISYPRELFPDTAIDYLRARLAGRRDVAAPPPLPPIPPLEKPTATVTAGPDTASRMAWAVTWRRNRRLTQSNAAIAAMAVLIVVAITGKEGLVAGALWAGVLMIAALTVRLAVTVADFIRVRRLFTTYAAEGAPLSSRFGSDAVAVRTHGFYSHLRYDSITKLTIRRHLVLLYHDGHATAFPRELFPDSAIAHIRAVNPGLH